MSNSLTTHDKNLRLMLCVVFKTVNRLNPEIMWDSFNMTKTNKYSLRRGQNLQVPLARTTRATNSFDFRAAMAWNHLAAKIKAMPSLKDFAASIKNVTVYCECIICSS